MPKISKLGKYSDVRAFGESIRRFVNTTGVTQYGYRIAWVTRYWIRIPRDFHLTKLIELYLAWSARVERHNHVVYAVKMYKDTWYNREMYPAEDDEGNRYETLYIGFSDDYMYIGDQIRLEHELCHGCDALGSRNLCVDPRCAYYAHPENVAARRTHALQVIDRRCDE